METGTVREKWSDERLDDLNRKVDVGFADTRAEFRAMRTEFASLYQLILGLYATMILGFAGLIVSHV